MSDVIMCLVCGGTKIVSYNSMFPPVITNPCTCNRPENKRANSPLEQALLEQMEKQFLFGDSKSKESV